MHECLWVDPTGYFQKSRVGSAGEDCDYSSSMKAILASRLEHVAGSNPRVRVQVPHRRQTETFQILTMIRNGISTASENGIERRYG